MLQSRLWQRRRLARYLEVYVDPTFDDFHKSRTSHRLAFLTCVAIFHSVDRWAEETGESTATLRQKWKKEYQHFGLVDVLAHHFKHVKSTPERIPKDRQKNIPIAFAFALGLSDSGETMNIRDLYYVIRDTVRFCSPEGWDGISKAAGTICSTTEAGSSPPRFQEVMMTVLTSSGSGS
jgi:hypothetical protein